MAWTAPTTRATGDLITASIWNVDLVDNLTATTHLVDVKVTEKDVVSTAAKVDLWNSEIALAANALAANGVALFRTGGDYLNNTGSNATIRIQFEAGSMIWDSGTSAVIPTNGARRPWTFFAVLQALNATNAQRASGQFWLGYPVSTTGLGTIDSLASGAQFGAAGWEGPQTAMNMTASQAFAFSVTHSSSSASLSMRCHHCEVEVINNL